MRAIPDWKRAISFDIAERKIVITGDSPGNCPFECSSIFCGCLDDVGHFNLLSIAKTKGAVFVSV